jgi:hypothetical protein
MSRSSQPCMGCAHNGTESPALNDQRVQKSVSGACGLAGFAVAILSGLAADNPASVILTRALVAMVVCYAVGVFVGMLASRAVRQATIAHAEVKPAPAIEEVRRGAQLAATPSASNSQPPPRAEAA